MPLFEDLRIPIWRESRVALEYAALRRDPVLQGKGITHGEGAPVLLIPGFLAGDPSLRTMALWLRRIGYQPCRAGMRLNADCATRAVERLETHLEALAGRYGRRVSVVGQSRGGSLARLLAVRRPDLVERIVCLGSPLSDPFAVHPLVRANVEVVALLGSLRAPGVFSRQCLRGACCAQVREHAAAPVPEQVQFTSVYSRSDGIVDWRSCLDPGATVIEVTSSHAGMSVHPDVFRAIAGALAPVAKQPPQYAAANQAAA